MDVKLIIKRAGGVNALARELEISPAAVSQWRRIPAERVLEIERITGVPCWEIRPDIFPPERFATKRAA